MPGPCRRSHRRHASSSALGRQTPSSTFSCPSEAGSAASSHLRRPHIAHLNLSTSTPPGTQPELRHQHHSVPAQYAHRHSFPYAVNPYGIPHDAPAVDFPQPPTYAFTERSSSEVPSPLCSPAIHGDTQQDESLFDRWLRHEEMSQPMYPPTRSRAGSSLATSDISSVRGGMFGSFPPSVASGPGSTTGREPRGMRGACSIISSVSAACARHSQQFNTRPPTRDSTDNRSVAGESYASSDAFPPSIDTRLQHMAAQQQQFHPGFVCPMHSCRSASVVVAPSAPTPPAGTDITAASGTECSCCPSIIEEDDEPPYPSPYPAPPAPAATRPPRYSDPALAAPPTDLATLLTRGVVGYQTTVDPNPSGAANSNRGTVVLVQEEVWTELRRLAGLERPSNQMVGCGQEKAVETVPQRSMNGFEVDLEKGEGAEPSTAVVRQQQQQRRQVVRRRKGGMLGCCVISVAVVAAVLHPTLVLRPFMSIDVDVAALHKM